MDISTFISNVGFPIACCVYMGYYLQQVLKSHKEEMEIMAQSVENNTQAIKELTEEIRKGGEKNGKSD